MSYNAKSKKRRGLESCLYLYLFGGWPCDVPKLHVAHDADMVYPIGECCCSGAW